MLRILVADAVSEEGLARLRGRAGVQVDIRTGLSPADLAPIVGDYDGMIIRSGVRITAEVLRASGRLRAIARAGAGVDNVDVPAATAAGVLVMNTPDANTISTAEQTFAVLLALFRNVPAAHAHVVGGGWDRKAFLGRQLADKTLGIVGFGRVGRAVAERALAFRMTVLAFDPFLSAGTAMDGRVTVVRTIDELLPKVDCLTLHATLTDSNRNLINAERLAKMKPTAVLLNCARGGLVDESALADALNNGRLAGAGVDVFASEPPKNCPLLAARNVVLTPHLGASTEEAQSAVSLEAVDALLDYLVNGTIRNAVNVADLPSSLSERDRAYLDLAARMGAILSSLCSEGIDRVVVTTQGGAALAALGRTLALAALVDAMNRHVQGRLNLINADAVARERGIDVHAVSHAAEGDFPERVTVRIERANEFHEVEGAVFRDGRPRILAIDGYRMEMVPDGRLVLIFNDDRPGVIGLVGTLFGKHELNIADLFLSRRGKTALMLLKVDESMNDALLGELRRANPPILSVRTVSLPPLPARTK